MIKSPLRSEASRRTIDEPRIVDFLMLRGWPIELRSMGREAVEAEAKAALGQLIALGLPYRGSEAGQRRFDPVEVTNFVIWAGCEKGDQTYPQRYMASARRLIRAVYDSDGGGNRAPSPETLLSRRYAVTLKRTFNLEDYRTGERVRLRLPLPIEDAAPRDMRIEFLPSEGLDARTSVGPARLDVIASVPADGEITAGLRATFTAKPSVPSPRRADLDPAERELYTRPNEGLVRVTERIEALAKRLAGAASDTRLVLRCFWDFMLGDLALGAIHYDELDPAKPLDTVLDQGWYDCRAGAALFVGLCRALGIPARMVNGYTLYTCAPSLHTWLEVWVDGFGWKPIDLVCWGLTIDRNRRSDWRDFFFGQIDHRMAVERPPRLFGGTGSVRLPPAWHMLNYADGAATVAEFRAMDSGALVYRERVAVERLDQASPFNAPE